MAESLTDTEPIVAVDRLSVRIGETALVDEIGLELRAGEVLTLFGPSGAGKTTIASAIAGCPAAGTRLTGSIRVTGKLGYLPQTGANTLNPARRIGNALTELLELHNTTPSGRAARKAWRANELERLLELVAFDQFDEAPHRTLRRYPFEFSGGQRTRLALAQVLATNPDVLVLDEPTEGLDAIARAKLVERLAKLRTSGTAIILVTHDHQLAEELSDRLLAVHEGRLLPEPPSLPEPPDPPAHTEPAHTEPALELRELSFPPALHDIELELRHEETLGLVGVSGAGKTTIAGCAAGLVTPREGAVLLDGEPLPRLRKRDKHQLAQLQYVWQESASTFQPRRSVLEQVATTAVRLRGLSPERAREEAGELLEDLWLPAEAPHRFPAGLSGGQLRRAALARALLARPRVLICDEITNGLDEQLVQHILERIEHYRRETGASVITISHNLRAQLATADRIAVVDAGRITEIGTPDRLVRAPGTTALRRLLTADKLREEENAPE